VPSHGLLWAIMSKEIARLIIGFRRFKEKYFSDENSVYRQLAASGQSPKTMLIGCADSRVDPAILTDASPGEIFVVRNVANLIPPCEHSGVGFHGTSSALEFAVGTLQVENIIILGHRQCGGVRALMSGVTDNPDSFIGHWMSIAEDARKKVLKEHAHADEDTRWRAAEMESLKVSLRNLRSFPFVQKAISERGLNVIAVYFDLEQGELWDYDESNDRFRQIGI
jgi:carbonic anhydrase